MDSTTDKTFLLRQREEKHTMVDVADWYAVLEINQDYTAQTANGT